mmetsp:Transcript_6445/g.22173  ORF Transcript_6445/g.22173 Transcript_6445/m.22173 type:complete len:219 (-) Transcript_6445:333-989(-)
MGAPITPGACERLSSQRAVAFAGGRGLQPTWPLASFHAPGPKSLKYLGFGHFAGGRGLPDLAAGEVGSLVARLVAQSVFRECAGQVLRAREDEARIGGPTVEPLGLHLGWQRELEKLVVARGAQGLVHGGEEREGAELGLVRHGVVRDGQEDQPQMPLGRGLLPERLADGHFNAMRGLKRPLPVESPALLRGIAALALGAPEIHARQLRREDQRAMFQ